MTQCTSEVRLQLPSLEDGDQLYVGTLVTATCADTLEGMHCGWERQKNGRRIGGDVAFDQSRQMCVSPRPRTHARFELECFIERAALSREIHAFRDCSLLPFSNRGYLDSWESPY